MTGFLLTGEQQRFQPAEADVTSGSADTKSLQSSTQVVVFSSPVSLSLLLAFLHLLQSFSFFGRFILALSVSPFDHFGSFATLTL